MSKSLFVEPKAELEIDLIIGNYENERVGKGRAFFRSILAILKKLQKTPYIGNPVVTVPDVSGVQWIRVKQKSPHIVIYLESEEAIRVVAVAHSSQRPGYWIDRL